MLGGVPDLERCQTDTCPLTQGSFDWTHGESHSAHAGHQGQQLESPLPSHDLCKQPQQELCLIRDELCTGGSLSAREVSGHCLAAALNSYGLTPTPRACPSSCRGCAQAAPKAHLTQPGLGLSRRDAEGSTAPYLDCRHPPCTNQGYGKRPPPTPKPSP